MKAFLFVLTLLAMPVHAQITFYSDSLGMPLGTANQVGNTTFYSNALGLPLGTANTPQPIPSYNAPRITTPPAPLFPTSPTFPSSPRGW